MSQNWRNVRRRVVPACVGSQECGQWHCQVHTVQTWSSSCWFSLPSYPASAGTALRIPRARPAAGGRAEYWGEILTAQKKYLPNVPGFSFSCCWKPQGYWVWHIKVQKSSRDWFTVFRGYFLIWYSCSWQQNHLDSHTESYDVHSKSKRKTLLNVFPFPLCVKSGISLCCCEDVWRCLLWQVIASDILDVEMVSKTAKKSKQCLENIMALS